MSEKKIAWEKWDTDLIEEEILAGLDFEEDDEEMIDEALKLMQKIPKLIFRLYRYKSSRKSSKPCKVITLI